MRWLPTRRQLLKYPFSFAFAFAFQLVGWGLIGATIYVLFIWQAALTADEEEIILVTVSTLIWLGSNALYERLLAGTD